MKAEIEQFINSKKTLMQMFKCRDDYFIKSLVDLEWALRTDEGVTFLTYWNDSNNKVNLVVTRKNGNPQIYKNGQYTLIIAIDCIKIAFLLENSKNIVI